MAKNYVGPGATVEHVAAAAITSGQVVTLGHCVGVALGDAAIGETVVCAIEGVFEVPKVPAAVFAVGEKLVWDISAAGGAGEFDDSSATPATGDLTGAAVAVKAGANLETTAIVKLTPGNATRA